MSFVKFYIGILYAGTRKVNDLKKKLKYYIINIYVQYRGVDESQSSQLYTPSNEDADDNIFSHHNQEIGHKNDPKPKLNHI